MLVPLFAHAEAVLTADNDIKVLSINGQPVSQGLFGNTQSFALPAGETTIDARYERLYEQGKDHEIVRSASLKLKALLDDNRTYHLHAPTAPKNLQSARQYAKTIQVSLVDAQGNLIAQSVMGKEDGFFAGLGLGSLFDHDEDTLEAFKTLWSKASQEERNKIRQWLK